MVRLLLVIALYILYSNNAFGQNTITIKPNALDGKDAMILSGMPFSNTEPNHEFMSITWTCGGVSCSVRSLIDFDISAIPQGVTIIDAKLILYPNPTPQTVSTAFYGINNATLIERIISNWDESNVSWSSQPQVDSTLQILIPHQSNTNYSKISSNITPLVKAMISNPNSSYGFRIKLADEQHHNCMIYASSDHTDSTKHPELVITYITTSQFTCVSHQPNDQLGKDALILSELPNLNTEPQEEFMTIQWTCGGNPCIDKALIEFDLSSIPQNSTIIKADLSLYANPTPITAIPAMQGINHAVLQRIVSPWSENNVTWNTTPMTTYLNEKYLAKSTVSNQDYLNIDVRELVQDMINDPNNSYGFMLSLLNEINYTCMIFCSSDYPDTQLHPKLDICYLVANGQITSQVQFDIYPSITNDEFFIILNTLSSDHYTLTLINNLGQKIFYKKLDNLTPGKNIISNSDLSIDVALLAAGKYYFSLTSKDLLLTANLVVIK